MCPRPEQQDMTRDRMKLTSKMPDKCKLQLWVDITCDAIEPHRRPYSPSAEAKRAMDYAFATLQGAATAEEFRRACAQRTERTMQRVSGQPNCTISGPTATTSEIA